jgi:uncharacterized YccA/Bax inhibitor family protein
MPSGNPSLNERVFRDLPRVSSGDAMSVEGTVNKTGFLLLLLVCTASFSWMASVQNPAASTGLAFIGVIGALIAALVTVFKKTASPISAPVYALFEGLVLGSVSSIFEAKYPGIVVQAVAITFGVLFCLLAAYKSRLIQVTNNFRLMVVAATGGIALVYFVGIILQFFNINLGIFGSGPFGILFSVVVAGIAAFNLVLDFDFIESGAAFGAPRYMEWYGAFGLMVTLVWLYMEILRLLSKLRERR